MSNSRQSSPAKKKSNRPAQAVLAGRVVEDHVVAEQVGMDHAARQRHRRARNAATSCWKASSSRSSADRSASRKGSTSGTVRVAPGQAARVGLAQREVGAGQVQPRQHLAHLFDVLQVRRIDMPALQPVQQRGRPALQPVQDLTLRVGLRFGHGQAVPRQVLHVVQVEGQFLEGQPLEQRQYPFALAVLAK